MSNNYRQSAQLSRPPQLYSPPSPVPSLALPVSTVSTDHSPISLSSYPTTTNTASNRSFQGRKIPQLDTTALTLDRVVEQHHFSQSSLNSSSSSISNYFNNQTLSPNYLIFPNTPSTSTSCTPSGTNNYNNNNNNNNNNHNNHNNNSSSSPSTPRRSSILASNLVLGSHQQSIIERTSLTEITIFTQNQYNLLKLLCSDRPSIHNLEYWENMLLNEKFPSTNSGQDAYDVEMATVSLAIEFATNNDKTANFNTLLLHALSQMNQVLDPEFTGEIPEAAYNSLFLVRIFSKHFIGNMTHDEIHRQFEGPITSILSSSPNGNNENKTRSFSLSSSSSSSGEEHEEPEESEEPEEHKGVYKLNQDKLVIDPEIIHDSRPKAVQLLDGLLNIILKIDPMSTASAYEYYQECLNTILVLFSTQIHQPSSNKNGNDYFLNIYLNQFSHLNDKLTLQLMTNFVEQRPPPSSSTSVVYNAYSYLFPGRSTATLPSDPLPVAERSLLILLLLAAQWKIPGQKYNKFREGIKSLKDSQGSEDFDMAISFRSLYQLICRQLPNEEICLMLYLLMVENEDFRVYILSRLDPEILLLQILRLLYDGIEGKANYSQMYILLTILLLFSQDEVFNENIQKITITYQPWFTERLLRSISLGGLTYLVLIRIIQFNLSSHRDAYFHTNCLATLANLGNSIQDIHPYVAQRLVNLFNIVAKRYQKLVKKEQNEEDEVKSDDVAIYADLVCLVLEIINSILSRRLNSNLQLIYSLLHKKDLFTHFQLHPRFSELIANFDNVISYFNSRISESNLKSPSAEEVTELIETAARTWPPGRLKEFPDLKFQYEEESDSQEFFCPYVWALLYRHTWIYWDEDKVRILHNYIIYEEMETNVVE
ncbi:hypothetical protein Glove_306g9 [Diversispora epigaea]|uniref:Dymeclin n=1 Tax=Diversispora epigaea TaxID=1348612 RepID=A0A397I197_9GLOM|nr:hypothetical protein Glove_306g9 [Diversispora epigaea]